MITSGDLVVLLLNSVGTVVLLAVAVAAGLACLAVVVNLLTTGE